MCLSSATGWTSTSPLPPTDGRTGSVRTPMTAACAAHSLLPMVTNSLEVAMTVASSRSDRGGSGVRRGEDPRGGGVAVRAVDDVNVKLVFTAVTLPAVLGVGAAPGPAGRAATVDMPGAKSSG